MIEMNKESRRKTANLIKYLIEHPKDDKTLFYMLTENHPIDEAKEIFKEIKRGR